MLTDVFMYMLYRKIYANRPAIQSEKFGGWCYKSCSCLNNAKFNNYHNMAKKG